MAQHFDEIQAGDAAAGAVGDVALNGQHDGRPVVVARQARGDDSDDALMPVAPGDKQRIVALPGEVALDLLAGFLVDLLLLLLPDAVERLELRGALVGVDDMLGFKQLQRDVRIADPAGGVDARAPCGR